MTQNYYDLYKQNLAREKYIFTPSAPAFSGKNSK
jgi:hypothetical protein